MAATVVEELPGLKEKPIASQQSGPSPPTLQPKPFFWDSIIFYLVSAILGLSVSGIIVDFLRPDQNLISCFSDFTSRAQYTFVNSYCHKFLPIAEYFSLALLVHAAALLVPHFLWKVYVSAQVDFFFSHAAKLETLRERDTGEYPHKNFSIVDYMHREFHDRRVILFLYIAKLILQLVLISFTLVISAAVFTSFNVTFECEVDEIEGSSFFSKTSDFYSNAPYTCAYARILFINILRVADYILLTLAIVTLAFGIYWCLLQSHPNELGHLPISQFCYDSCINSKHFKPKKRYRLKNDFHFLLAFLFATNAGLGRVFKSVQIANDITHELSAHFESLASYDSMKHSISGREKDQRLNKFNFFRHHVDSTSFGELIYDLCEAISNEMGKVYGYNTSKLAALDIGCGYHSYMFGIARWQLQVISIVLDSYYKNSKEVFTNKEYHAGVMLMRIPTNLFGLPKVYKRKFTDTISDYLGLTNNDTDEEAIKFSLIVVGALDSQRKHNTVNQIVEMHSRSDHFFKQGAIMLIVKPIAVENTDISHHFNDWKPESSKFWQPSFILNTLIDWPKDKTLTDEHCVVHNGCIVNIKCGQTWCKFQLTAYKYDCDPGAFLAPDDCDPEAFLAPASSTATINSNTQEDEDGSVSDSAQYYRANNIVSLDDKV